MSDQSQPWMTIREAAVALGVSDLTIRRRIKDGRLVHRLSNGKYYVDISRPAPEPPAPQGEDRATPLPAGVTETQRADPVTTHLTDQNDHVPVPSESEESSSPPASSLDLDALLAEHSRLAAAAGRARLLEEQLAQLSERHAHLQDSVVSLATRNGWLESKLEERESEIKLLEDTQRRASWWRRLFGAS